MKGYDYAQEGAYFVTICTHQREHLFGMVTDDTVQLTTSGEIAYTRWHAIPDHFPNAELDLFIIMPNHMHGIILILDNPKPVSNRRDVACYVPTKTVHDPTGHYARISPKTGSLSAIVRSYKSAVTKSIRQILLNDKPIWQGRYHDRIIRNERELNTIRGYVQTNPSRWTEDRYYAGM